MGCFMIVPIAAAIGVLALQFGSFVGLFLAAFTTVITSLAAVVGLLMLW
jgi:hypothetical protein